MAEWRAVSGFPAYEVSSEGGVRRADTVGELAPYRTPKGYLRVDLHRDGEKKTRPVHQLVVEAFIGPRRGLQVNHKDADKSNNRVENLELVTPRENARHASRLGLFPKERPTHRGERHGGSKLTAPQVRDIRRLHAGGRSQRSLAREYGVHPQNVNLIVRRKAWRHI